MITPEHTMTIFEYRELSLEDQLIAQLKGQVMSIEDSYRYEHQETHIKAMNLFWFGNQSKKWWQFWE